MNYPQKLLETAHPNKQNQQLFDVYYPWLSRINATDVKIFFFYQFPSKFTVFQVSF